MYKAKAEGVILLLFLSVYFLYPTFQFGAGSKFLLLFAIILVALVVLLRSGRINVRRGFIHYTTSFIVCLVAVVLAGVTGLINKSEAIVHWASLFRIVYFYCMVTFFMVLFESGGRQLLLKFSKFLLFFLCLEFIFILMQAFNYASVLSNIYLQDKMRGLDSYMRATGTFGNPNSLAIITVLSMLYIFFYIQSPLKKVFTVVLSGAIILFSGSRTGLFIYILALLFLVMEVGFKDSFRNKLSGALFAIVLLIISSFLLDLIESSLPYLWSVVSVAGDLDAIMRINSLSARIGSWEDKILFFEEVPISLKYIFGAGFYEAFKVLDNDYLFLVLRTGLFGMSTYLSFIMFPYIYGFLHNKKQVGRKSLFWMAFIIGGIWAVFFEFYSDFMMPVLFFSIIAIQNSNLFFSVGNKHSRGKGV